jgi:hypothetical protein
VSIVVFLQTAQACNAEVFIRNDDTNMVDLNENDLMISGYTITFNIELQKHHYSLHVTANNTAGENTSRMKLSKS